MEDQKKKSPNKWLALINIPFQMGIVIFAFAWLGQWLDENHPNPKVYYNKILVVVGVFLALYNVIRQVNELNKNE
ncbi:putative F0F1-ATPase subunit (Ca2+/Mg2+ transporter) [Flavobacterium cauense R2A-7]|uniref:Putative F0F1-ATPase subunit (Ca2+/Mg2+ transporter) n=1 Tax=Flavobacterium cauense R2A-7 TaxID=1341154 RepID=A0A562M085_9FLAO|nr:AtpZ/AtpI family protein [Flavobacterium cauense]KGO81352.1 F0F1-ATPase subunit [Flavobacterium cauense R2A-7]TWI13198.1 putative F0F1-ATPase subunit (Ca2+/Mg2+ transporter) [Flavobacterium cauense R2A-7]